MDKNRKGVFRYSSKGIGKYSAQAPKKFSNIRYHSKIKNDDTNNKQQQDLFDIEQQSEHHSANSVNTKSDDNISAKNIKKIEGRLKLNVEADLKINEKVKKDMSKMNQQKENKEGEKDEQDKEKRENNDIKEVKRNKSKEEKADTKDNEEIRFFLGDLKKKKLHELMELAESLSIHNISNLHKHELIFAILQKLSEKGGVMVADGILEIVNDNYGFLRSSDASYFSRADDIYIPANYIRKNGLRRGDKVCCTIKPPHRGEKYFTVKKVEKINNIAVEKLARRVYFDDLTPTFPNERIRLEDEKKPTHDLSMRIVDLVSPIGKGQRALIVAPPRTGKTVLIQNIAHSITANHPEATLIVLLIDERPEEVTDMQRSVQGEVVSSTFDESSVRHVQLAEMVIEKAKRMVEVGKDVIILLDSITRLARAYNNVAPSSGKVLSGGVDSNALQRPKRFFGAARNIEEGGSLTIIATALIETGSRMDEVIFEEFKGTGNSEIILDRKLSDRRIFPALDIIKSGTRKEDLLLEKSVLFKTYILRKMLNPMGTAEAMEFITAKLKVTKNNVEFFESMDTNNFR